MNRKIKSEITYSIKQAVEDLYDLNIDPELSRTQEQFGDYSTNAAMQLASKLGQNPRQVAQAITQKLNNPSVAKADVAGPGFINFTLSDEALVRLSDEKPERIFNEKTILVEYSDPNPFKILHAGHFYTSVVGDAIANLFESAGGKVHRLNFGGDVGLHAAKTMWAILKDLGGERPESLKKIDPKSRTKWVSEAYVKGNNVFEKDGSDKDEILELNKKIYAIHDESDKTSPLAKIYWTCRQWSYDSFEEFYAKIGSRFDRYIPESETADIGIKTVNEHTPDVFNKSNGAVVFEAEKFGEHLHTRVFINSEGVPTYEAKDVGLIMIKAKDYKFDKSIVITGNEQEQYMMVVLKAIEQFASDLARNTTHLTHGLVKLKDGQKMSSRRGNILRAQDVIDAAEQASQQSIGKSDHQAVLAAIKYAFLKNRMSGDIIYDPEESVSIHGNSGPYLQYAHARAKSILVKAKSSKPKVQSSMLEEDERKLLGKIGQYAEIIEEATTDLAPHHVCTYLYELCQVFNHFYEKNRVIGDKREQIRLWIVKKYAENLRSGLELLGISAPDRM